MSELFQNKYRIPTARLETWDYASQGMYFVTICTKSRECFFGNIQENQVVLTDLGQVAQSEWLTNAELRRDMNSELGDFIIMPNHIHGIILIGENPYNNSSITRDAMHRVSTKTINEAVNKFGAQSKNLSSVIRGYKSAVTAYAGKNNLPFDWQARFHDRIVRSPSEYQNIANYIQNNPLNWPKDELYKI